MHKQNHIALWACPRSCSTLLARSFEQRVDCQVIDEPFYSPYFLTHGLNHPFREHIMAVRETDISKIVEELDKPFTPPKQFGFQKHIAKNVLPHFGTEWFPEKNIFLLREPVKIARSIKKIIPGDITLEDIGIEALYRIFQYMRATNATPPLVIHANDLLVNPRKVLQKICDTFDIPFLESMMSWKAGLEDSNLFFTGALLPYSDNWYGGIKNSTGFKPFPSHNDEVPEKLLPVIEACMPIYEALSAHAVHFQD